MPTITFETVQGEVAYNTKDSFVDVINFGGQKELQSWSAIIVHNHIVPHDVIWAEIPR